jgi:hypothetical protein
LRSSRTPNSTMPMPMARTRNRNLRLDPTIQANTQTPPTLGCTNFLLGPSTRRPKAAFEQALCQYAMRLNQKRFSSYGLRPRVTPV